MKNLVVLSVAVLSLNLGLNLVRAQSMPTAHAVKGPDERFKTDILVVVAHPDDEGGVTPYLARAIYDEHKRVAVVFATRGGSGGNDFTREHGPALADIREQEARQACAKLGITNVWFLDGKDTASQNVLNSLANWGHGANLEALVRIVRLTRPEVIITWLPGIFIGENHGDHQASGVLATEAFDMADDPTAFPAQVAGATKRLEAYLENLTPWQPKKLYFFSDADDQKQFAGSGPAYSVKEISPSQKKPYWRLAMDAATPHLTQFPAEIHQLTAMSDEQINKFMEEPQHSWWTEPMTLIFGKAAELTPRFQSIFPEVEPRQHEPPVTIETYSGPGIPGADASLRLAIGGPWKYYETFRAVHKMSEMPVARTPEIGVKSGSVIGIPLIVYRKPTVLLIDAKTISAPHEIRIKVTVPTGWKVISGEGNFNLPDDVTTQLRVEIQTPDVPAKDLKDKRAESILVEGISGNTPFGSVGMKVSLRTSALPE
jgi:LmbE family N-acetylglucosaminyl deacetylase